MNAQPLPGELNERALAALTELGGVVSQQKDMINVTVPKGAIVDAMRACRAAGLEMLSDIFGIDYLSYPGHRGKRFAVVYNVHCIAGTDRLFVRVALDDGESLPTVTTVWRGANFLERETFDMFGIEFEGHPNLRKLLTPEDLDGHPHRKDFPIGETPTLFNDGRFLDPAAFRAGLTGRDPGLTGWKGGAREGVVSEQGTLPGEGRDDRG